MSWRRPRHVHVWLVHGTTYADPVTRQFSIKNADSLFDQRSLEKIMFGVTTFLLRCDDPTCGETKTVECLGKQVTPDPVVAPAQ